VQPDAERNLIVGYTRHTVKPRNDADSGRIAAYEMDFDFRWWNDVGTDYGRVQSFMGENILGFDIFRILRLWPSMSNFAS